jgi:hypothetical protein
MPSLVKGLRSNERAAALIIVLAFVVLFAGLGVAYFSRTTSDRQVAHSSFNQSNVDLLAQSAMDNIIGDLRQEVSYGSASPAPTFGAGGSTFNLYVPCMNVGCTTPTPFPGWNPCPNSTPTILPVSPIYYPTPTAGTTPAIPNLIRRSVRSDPIPCPARASRASAVNSLADASANGRSVSLARWNSHYLIPKSNTTDAGSDPITTGYTAPNYWAPDWVFVNGEGATVITEPDTSIIGRYAYMIYDEGGLLDMNAAGYPSPTTILQHGRKGSLAFTDLTGLSSYGLSTTALDNVVGWRNYASARPSGSFSPSPTPNFSFNTNATNTYYNFILSDPTNITLTNYFTNLPLTYFTNSFLTTSQAPVFNNQTDQALTARQELLKLRSGLSGGGIGFVNALQYLGTFSRESLSKIPQWSPTTPDSINPNFQTLLAGPPPTPSPTSAPAFTRNDGTTAYVGDYFVNRRFLLQRLNWLTYRGPSGPSVANPLGRNIPTSAPSWPPSANSDYDMWLLTRGANVSDVNSIRFGLTSVFLKQGTDDNVLRYFGLVWDTTNERWNYTSPSGGLLASSIATLGTLTETREPDFFELLQAGIINGSLGDSFSSDPALPLTHQQSKMLHILTIGANLIAQSRADSYPVRIACNVGGTTMEAVGMPRLPYLNSLGVCPVGVSQNTGGVNWLLVPNLWDPFKDTWDLTQANTGNTGNKPLSTPGYLRPPVRITVTGNVGFGAATASQSGSVDPTSVTTFSTTATGINLSLTLATGNSMFGRDGLLEAMRLGASDINGSVTSFNPANSSSGFAWNDVVRPANDTSTYRSDHFVVFRLSIPGTDIPSGSVGLNPVLILQPGFQMRLEYQSPNGQWYPYSFLQGNNETITTIGYTNPSSPTNLCLATTFSKYDQPGGYTSPTVVTNSNTAALWSDITGALAHAPMFAKSDPRSIRYNSLIGVIDLANPPMTFNSAGVVGSIWPSPYAAPPGTPPPMIPSAYPTPTPTPNPNPATLGDNLAAGGGNNPYNESFGTAENSHPYRQVMMNRPFRSVGEMGYAFRDQPFRTLSFSSANSPDAALLDLFSTNDSTNSVGTRGGVVNLNSRQAPALAGLFTGTIGREDTPRGTGAAPSPSPSPLASPSANSVATSLTISTIATPVVNRADLATLIANETGLGPTVPKTQREAIARALGEVDQTRTWNLFIDVIAQTGRYPPNATSLENGFVVTGEQRYWVHVAIDRFTGRVIDKQIEVVNE